MKSLILVLLAAAWPEKCNDDIPCLCAAYTEAKNCFRSCPDDGEAKTYAETADDFCDWGADELDDTPE
ncbi:hypothetical protein Neosp_013266 [[Neocosmospora] mangrovei]